MPVAKPFDLPDFYLPWPGRLNPRVDETREHSRAWAKEIGMLDCGVWDERSFQTADYALLSAYCYPEARGPVLDLITDWYIWGFFYDDWFHERYKRVPDVLGAIEYVGQISRFMPMDADQPVPEPSDPVQRALAELWSRTVPLMSAAWRHRFADSTFAQMRDSIWELENLTDQRVPNPVEYLEIRRGTGGGRWAADFVELAADAEIPVAVVGTRPLRVLRDTIGDAAYLRNDIFSYQREVEVDGDVSNFVLVLERFLGLNAQSAADKANDLITSRMQQFDNTVLTELPALFEDHRLNPAQRLDVLRYAKGLQDWQAGCHEWHACSSRYMKAEPSDVPATFLAWGVPRGLGTAAARLFWSYAPVDRSSESLAPMDFALSSSVRISPHLAALRVTAAQWANDMGMLDGLVWDSESFAASDFAAWTAMTHPDAPLPRLEMVTKWQIWRFYLIDTVAAMFKRSRNLLGAKLFLARLPAFLRTGAAAPQPVSPAERAIVNLWPATAADMSAGIRRQFPGHIEDLAEGLLWEVANTVQGRVPDPIDFMEMRRQSGGSEFSLDLLQYALGADFSSQALSDTFADIGSWQHDILSYPVKVKQEGEVSNGVLGLQRFLGCDSQQAADICNNLVTARLRQLEQLSAGHTELGGHLTDVRHWLAGDLRWGVERAETVGSTNEYLCNARSNESFHRSGAVFDHHLQNAAANAGHLASVAAGYSAVDRCRQWDLSTHPHHAACDCPSWK